MGADDPRNSWANQYCPVLTSLLLWMSEHSESWLLAQMSRPEPSPRCDTTWLWYQTQPTLPSSLHDWTYLEKKKTLAPLNTIFELLALDCLTSCARVNNFGSPISSAPPAPVFHPACPHGWNTSTSSFQVSFYDEKCTEGVLIKTSCCALYYLVWWSLYC